MMNEENMDNYEATQTIQSKSAFSGISDEDERQAANVGAEIAETNVSELVGPLEEPLKATKYGHSFALLVPQRIIPKHVRTDVVEVKVARASDPSRKVSLYTTHLPGYKHAYLDLQALAPRFAEEFWIVTVRLYSESEFVSEYNSAKPRGLENIELAWEPGTIELKVAKKTVPLAGPLLRTYQGQAVLDCGLGLAGPIKITKAPGGFELRLKDHSPVASIAATDELVILTYVRTQHETRPHRRIVARFGTASKGVAPSNYGPVPERLGLIRVSRGDFESIELEIDSIAKDYVRSKLADVKSMDEYKRAKGSIAEAIVMRLIPGLDVEFVADHPTNRAWWKTGSDREGPDLLVRVAGSDEFCYVEVKWWDNVEDAMERAEAQVLADMTLNPKYLDQSIDGAFIAVLDWKANDDTVRLNFKRVA